VIEISVIISPCQSQVLQAGCAFKVPENFEKKIGDIGAKNVYRIEAAFGM
jgi:hypothetical protein